MATEVEPINIMPPATMNKIDPTGFDVTISAFLVGLEAEQYIGAFKKLNIGQSTLILLSDEDLIKMGVDNADLRKKIIEEAKNLPIYEEASNMTPTGMLGPIEIVEIVEESAQHLYNIYLSTMANTLSLKKKKKVMDSLLYKDQYASDIAIATINEMTNIINSMESTLVTQLKVLNTESNKKTKKLIVGSVGGAVIIMLAFFFSRSLKDIKINY